MQTTLIFLISLLISANLYSQTKNFVILNWSKETFAKDDFELKFKNLDSEKEFGVEIREYSIKEISISQDTGIEAIKIKTHLGAEATLKKSETSLEYTSRKNRNLKASIITTTESEEIIGVNICDNLVNNQEMTKQFVVFNLSSNDIPEIWILWGDGQEPFRYRKPILANSIATISIQSSDEDNDGYFSGRKVFNYYIPCVSNCSPSYIVNYSCSNGNDGRQQMLVGVEISNSGDPSNRIIVHKPK